MHSLLTRTGIAHHNRKIKSAVQGVIAGPTNAGGVVEVILLDAIGVEFAGESKVRECTTTGGGKGVLAFDAVEVAVEEAGVTVKAEEDEGIGEGLKERLDRSFEGLVGLCVVVHY